MTSILVFRGGPFDGRREQTQPGWPAPDAYEHRDFDGRYVRAEVEEGGGEVLHLYDYCAEGRDG